MFVAPNQSFLGRFFFGSISRSDCALPPSYTVFAVAVLQFELEFCAHGENDMKSWHTIFICRHKLICRFRFSFCARKHRFGRRELCAVLHIEHCIRTDRTRAQVKIFRFQTQMEANHIRLSGSEQKESKTRAKNRNK